MLLKIFSRWIYSLDVSSAMSIWQRRKGGKFSLQYFEQVVDDAIFEQDQKEPPDSWVKKAELSSLMVISLNALFPSLLFQINLFQFPHKSLSEPLLRF